MLQTIPEHVVIECRKRLLLMKQEILNRVRASKAEFDSVEKSSGDEIDLSVALREENNFLLSQKRLREHLLEIEFALGRIERGSFGVCEETDETIEIERLLAIPWTRLSIEGAEIREAMKRRFAHLE